MAARKQKSKIKKAPAAQSGSAILSAMSGTMLNMTATAVTFGSVLLCLFVAKHFT